MTTEIRIGTWAVDLLKVLLKSVCTERNCFATAVHQESERIATSTALPQKPPAELRFHFKHSTSARKNCASKTIRYGFKEFRAGAVPSTDERIHLSTSKHVFDCSLIPRTGLRLDTRAAERTAAKSFPKASSCVSRMKAFTNLKRWRRAGTVNHGHVS
jgi:hypothetical protein